MTPKSTRPFKPSYITLWSLATLPMIFAATMPGCVENPLASLFQPTATNGNLLNQLTTGDLAEAFAQFRNEVTGVVNPNAKSVLTNQQRASVESLQQQVDAGQLSQDQLSSEIWTVLGDTNPAAALVGANALGAPLGTAAGDSISDTLRLTDKQRQHAQAIQSKLRSDLEVLRQNAVGDISGVLTPEQQTALTGLGSLTGGASNSSLAGLVGSLTGGAASSQPTSSPGWKRQLAVLVFDQLVNQLNLTDAQKSQIALVRQFLVSGAKGLQQAARDQFMLMLTGQQSGLLSAIEGQ